jgi:hypothetical protein
MWRRGLACLAVLVLPGLALAQQGPERLLPANTQIFFRWDGFDSHRPAYDKTAVGKMMQGETGKFLDALWEWLVEAAQAGAGQADPQAAEFVKDGVAVLSSITKNGLAISVAVKGVTPPQAQLTLVFPKSGGVMIPLVNKLTGMAGAPVGETKVGNRLVQHVNVPPFVNIGWWLEGADAVFMVGTDEPAAYAKLIDAKETGLAQNALYKQVASFKEFPVWGRGYLDIAALAKMGSEVSPEVGRLIDDLGLKGIKSVTFVSGFDGAVERGIAEVDIPGPRKGLLALTSTKKITLADLPALPDDVTGFSASNFNMGKIYDTVIGVVEAVVRVAAPEQADNVKEGVNQIEGLLGVKLGEDLFGQFDDTFVSYRSPAEGPLGLGAVYLFKVKDEQKLQAALSKLLGAIPNLPFVPVEVKKRNYHGVDVNIVTVNAPGQINALSFATHKGWLIVGSYPQGVYGYILRAKGELPTWKADAKLTQALAAFPKEFTSISITDPRPTVQTVLSFLPPAITFANGFTQFAPGLRTFDVGLVPHAQEATRHLFPNITVTTDDGKKIRSDTRASLALPF